MGKPAAGRLRGHASRPLDTRSGGRLWKCCFVLIWRHAGGRSSRLAVSGFGPPKSDAAPPGRRRLSQRAFDPGRERALSSDSFIRASGRDRQFTRTVWKVVVDLLQRIEVPALVKPWARMSQRLAASLKNRRVPSLAMENGADQWN